MKIFLFTLASLMMIGTAYADNVIVMDNQELTTEQLGTTVTINMRAEFANYVSAFRIIFTDLPEGITVQSYAWGDGTNIMYLDADGNEETYTPFLTTNLTSVLGPTALAVSQQMAYLENGTYGGVAHWAPGIHEDFLRVTFAITENFAGGQLTWTVEPSAGGWGDHSNDCPKNSFHELNCDFIVNESNEHNIFHMDSTNVFCGETVTIPVQMVNEESVIAFQTDIVLPEGFSIVTDEDDEPIITPSSRLTTDHMIMAEQLNDGRIHVICYTPRSKVINGNEGDLFYFEVAVPENAGGDYNIFLRNSLLTTSDYSELGIPDAKANLHVYAYIPGDVNNSHTVTVTDIVFTAQYILQRNPSPFIFEAADMNGDGNITVTDIMLIANLIMPSSQSIRKLMTTLSENLDHMSGDDITIAAGETLTVSIELDNEMIYNAFQLDLHLPDGLIANNFQLTDRAGSHILDVETISDGTIRALCYSNTKANFGYNEGALLTFDVTAVAPIIGDITVDGIELVSIALQAVEFDSFTIGVNNATSVNELATGKAISRIDYFNLAGQQIDRPETGVIFVVTTYSDGTRSTSKVIVK